MICDFKFFLWIATWLLGMSGTGISQSIQNDSVWHVRYHQNRLTVEAYYENKAAEEINNMKMVPFVYHFYCNDWLGYQYIEGQGGNQLRRKRILGKKIRHHTQYVDREKKQVWYGINYPNPGKRNLVGLLPSTDSSKLNWTYFQESKNILGFTCQLAIAVTAQKDSVIAWYVPGLANGVNIHPYEQLPGLVLEVIHQALDTHLYAVDLKRENKLLTLPENPRIIQPSEWKEAIQRYKTHMGYDW